MSYLIGIYIGIMICVFFVTSFVTILGGKNKDIWRPFIYAPLWFIFIPKYMIKIKRSVNRW